MQFSPNNPYRMIKRTLFKGKNAPGSSAFGSKNPQEMAQKWVDKFGGGSSDYSYERKESEDKNGSRILSPVENVHHSYSGGGRIGFAERGSTNKEYLDFINRTLTPCNNSSKFTL